MGARVAAAAEAAKAAAAEEAAKAAAAEAERIADEERRQAEVEAERVTAEAEAAKNAAKEEENAVEEEEAQDEPKVDSPPEPTLGDVENIDNQAATVIVESVAKAAKDIVVNIIEAAQDSDEEKVEV